MGIMEIIGNPIIVHTFLFVIMVILFIDLRRLFYNETKKLEDEIQFIYKEFKNYKEEVNVKLENQVKEFKKYKEEINTKFDFVNINERRIKIAETIAEDTRVFIEQVTREQREEIQKISEIEYRANHIINNFGKEAEERIAEAVQCEGIKKDITYIKGEHTKLKNRVSKAEEQIKGLTINKNLKTIEKKVSKKNEVK